MRSRPLVWWTAAALIGILTIPVLAVPSLTATVPIGRRPVAVATDSRDHRVYVADVELGAVIPYDGTRGAVGAPITVGGQPASLRGRFIIDRGTRVRVNVLEATVGGSPIPVELVEGELAKINPILDLTGSPIPLRIRLIALHDDRIEVLAGSD